MKVKVEGTPVFIVCNNSNDILRDKYDRLALEELSLREEIKQKEARLAEIKAEYKVLNQCEIYNVLDYVRCYSRADKLSKQDLDAYLCHCQNKLNGNIDSIFLRFDNPVEDKDESISS